MRVRQAAKRDSNEKAVIAALRACGVSVEPLSGRAGLPDLLCGYRGANWLLEVKSHRGRLTEEQSLWWRSWAGQSVVVRSVDEALQLFGLASPSHPPRGTNR